MGSQPVTYNWRQFDVNLRTSLQDFLVDDSLVDVTLVAKDQSTFRAHKLVLAASCSYFREVFARCSTNGPSETVIVLPGVSRMDLNCLMQYWYSGQLNATKEQIASLKSVADTLRIRGLHRIGNCSLQTDTGGSQISDAGSEHSSDNNTTAAGTTETYEQTATPPRKRRRRRSPTQSVPHVPAGLTIVPISSKPSTTPSSSTAQDDGSDDSVSDVLAGVKPDPDICITPGDPDNDSTTYDEGTEYVSTEPDYPTPQDGDYGEYEGGRGNEEDMDGQEYQDYSSNSQLEGGGESNSLSYFEQQQLLSETVAESKHLMDAEGGVYASTSSDMQGSSAAEADRMLHSLQCSKCLHIFSHRGAYNLHVRTSKCSGSASQIYCPVCQRSFRQMVSYRSHMKSVHQIPEDSPLMMWKKRIQKYPLE